MEKVIATLPCLNLRGDYYLRPSDQAPISIREICRQHLIDDFGFEPELHHWSAAITPQDWMDKSLYGERPAGTQSDLAVYQQVFEIDGFSLPVVTLECQIEDSVKKFGGAPEDYRKIHEVMDMASGTERFLTHQMYFVHTFLPMLFGDIYYRPSDGEAMSVQDIGENHLTIEFGFYPTVDNWLTAMKIEPWMDNGKNGARPAHLPEEQGKIPPPFLPGAVPPVLHLPAHRRSPLEAAMNMRVDGAGQAMRERDRKVNPGLEGDGVDYGMRLD